MSKTTKNESTVDAARLTNMFANVVDYGQGNEVKKELEGLDVGKYRGVVELVAFRADKQNRPMIEWNVLINDGSDYDGITHKFFEGLQNSEKSLGFHLKNLSLFEFDEAITNAAQHAKILEAITASKPTIMFSVEESKGYKNTKIVSVVQDTD